MESRLKALIARSWASRHEFGTFLLFGVINTLLTYGLYLLLLLAVSYPAAYSASYVVGIFLSYVLNARFVFREPLRLSKALQYPVVYIVQYFLGLGLLYLMVEVFHLSEVVAPLAVVLMTVPCTFVLSRYVIRGRTRGKATP
jgi:putative flippase GtrA